MSAVTVDTPGKTSGLDAIKRLNTQDLTLGKAQECISQVPFGVQAHSSGHLMALRKVGSLWDLKCKGKGLFIPARWQAFLSAMRSVSHQTLKEASLSDRISS